MVRQVWSGSRIFQKYIGGHRYRLHGSNRFWALWIPITAWKVSCVAAGSVTLLLFGACPSVIFLLVYCLPEVVLWGVSLLACIHSFASGSLMQRIPA